MLGLVGTFDPGPARAGEPRESPERNCPERYSGTKPVRGARRGGEARPAVRFGPHEELRG